MKPIEISANSWHYKFITYFNQRWEVDRIDNICDYSTAFLKSVFFATLSLSFIVYMAASTGDGFAYIAAYVVERDFLVAPNFLSVGFAAVFLCASLGLVAWLVGTFFRLIIELFGVAANNAKSNIIGTMISSKLQGWCAKIKINHE